MTKLRDVSSDDLLREIRVNDGVSEMWNSPGGAGIRLLLADISNVYLQKVLAGDPHAFMGLRAIRDFLVAVDGVLVVNQELKAEYRRRSVDAARG